MNLKYNHLFSYLSHIHSDEGLQSETSVLINSFHYGLQVINF